MQEKEIWKSIEGYDGLYEVSNFGRVKSLSRRIWVYKPYGGYYKILSEKVLESWLGVIWLSDEKTKKKYQIGRLTAQAFLENPNNYPQVIHIDGDKTNNNIKNLKWGNFHDIIRKEELRKPVKCLETGKIYKTMTEAAKSINRDVQALSRCLKGGLKRTCAGYHWKYINT